jgi:hypothetical protein
MVRGVVWPSQKGPMTGAAMAGADEAAAAPPSRSLQKSPGPHCAGDAAAQFLRYGYGRGNPRCQDRQ